MATQFSRKWLVIGIDLFAVAVSFFLAYFVRFNLNLSFDVSKMGLQLQVVVLIALIAFLITGSHKGIVRQTGAQRVYPIFPAVALSSLLLLLFTIIIHYCRIFPDYGIPLSIIIIYSILSFLGITASRYAYRRFSYFS